MEYTEVTPSEFAELEGLDDWRYSMNAIRATFTSVSFPAGAALLTAFAEAAEAIQHHPDMEIRYPGNVEVVLTTHATGGLTTLDVDLARQYSAIAADRGHGSEPVTAQVVEIAIDTMDASKILPFWKAVLGYQQVGSEALVDPRRSGPPMWFQQMDEPRSERQRFHIDVSVAHDEAEARIAAAIAAGGTLVSDQYARSWWILADADGNEACVCTWQDR